MNSIKALWDADLLQIISAIRAVLFAVSALGISNWEVYSHNLPIRWSQETPLK